LSEDNGNNEDLDIEMKAIKRIQMREALHYSMLVECIFDGEVALFNLYMNVI